MFGGPYMRKNGTLVRCDENSPFPQIDEEFSVDPIEEISEDINTLMKGMAALHQSNRFLKFGIFLSIACNLYLVYSL